MLGKRSATRDKRLLLSIAMLALHAYEPLLITALTSNLFRRTAATCSRRPSGRSWTVSGSEQFFIHTHQVNFSDFSCSRRGLMVSRCTDISSPRIGFPSLPVSREYL